MNCQTPVPSKTTSDLPSQKNMTLIPHCYTSILPVTIPFQKAKLEGGKIKGTIAILDIQFGNIWTNISGDMFKQLNVKTGDTVKVSIYHNKIKKYEGRIPYVETFGSVAKNKPLLYLNSLMQVSFALNMGNFSEVYHIYSGNDWTVEISKLR